MYEKPFHKEDLSKFTFLVTGGAGFIGSHITEYLLKYKAGKVIVLDNLLTGRIENIDLFTSNKDFQFIKGDITDLNTCINTAKNVDFILHQAALGSVPRSFIEPQKTNAINTGGTLNMLIAAKENKVKRFIYASSSSVYGDNYELPKKEDKIGNPLSPYAVSKRTNELYANVFASGFGLEVIGLRYFNIFGPRQDPQGPYAAVIPKFINTIRSGGTVTIDGDGLQTRDFTFVENAVQANIKAVFAGKQALNQVYNVAVGESFSVNDLFKKLSNLLGNTKPAKFIESRAGDIRQSLADISKIKQLLDYCPSVSFYDGLNITIQSK
jgi:UDP-N-acetylglucosamine/UDP-N-acetylgalactosamine 4-epimerase